MQDAATREGLDFGDDDSDFAGAVWTMNVDQSEGFLGHERTRLENGGMGRLVGPGAHGHLVGEKWAKQQRAKGYSVGYIAEQTSLQDPLEVNGVGKGPDECREQWRLPIGTQEMAHEEEGVGSIDSYTAPVIPDNDVPALLGNASLRKLDAIVECRPGRLHLCGPGSRELVLPAGSKSIT